MIVTMTDLHVHQRGRASDLVVSVCMSLSLSLCVCVCVCVYCAYGMCVCVCLSLFLSFSLPLFLSFSLSLFILFLSVSINVCVCVCVCVCNSRLNILSRSPFPQQRPSQPFDSVWFSTHSIMGSFPSRSQKFYNDVVEVCVPHAQILTRKPHPAHSPPRDVVPLLSPHQLAALHAADPDGSGLTDLRAARQLVVRQGKCITAMLAYLDEEKKKGATPDKHAERDAEVQQMVTAFNASGGAANAKTWLAHAESAKESIGPKAVSVKLTEAAVKLKTEVLENTRQKFGPNSPTKPNLFRVTLRECILENARTELKHARDDLADTQHRFEDVRLTVAEQVGHSLVSDVARYETALENLTEADPKQYRALIQLVCSVGNRGALAKGRIVQVEVAGSLTKARVEEEVGGDGTEVTVSMWTEVRRGNKRQYEEGYDTSSKIVRTFPRAEIIGGTRKPTQRVTDATVQAASKNSSNPTAAAARIRDPKRPEFLVGLYCDAHASRGRVLALAEAAKKHINKPFLSDDPHAEAASPNLLTIVPGLKGMARACVKTAEKYGGSYVQLTDLCRMTFVCPTVETAMRVVEFIRDHPGWTVVRVKNRLDPVFDASATGGYRDLLINARDKVNGHIVELQLTFKEFYEIKTRGGHAVYKLARLLELNETETTDYVGQPTDHTLERIRVGIVRSVEFRDVEVPPAMRDALLTERGLLSRTCAIVCYKAYGIASLQGLGITRAMPVTVLRHLGQNLTELTVSRCGIVGTIPEAIGEYCTSLRVLKLNSNPGIQGSIPKNFANLRKLHILRLNDCGLSGPVPWESLLQMTRLRHLRLKHTQLSGELPTELGRMRQ